MSSRWLREITYDYSGVNTNWWRKAYSLWLRYVMDFTFQTESVAGGNSWVSTEKNGTGGAFAGATYSFTDAAATFVIADQGKYLIINDNTNPVNAGIYKIRRYVSSTEIEIDFRAGYQEYPIASSGLAWRICAGDYQVPAAEGDYVRLQSRHSTGWAVELTRTVSLHYAIIFRVATNGSWSGPTIGNIATPARYGVMIKTLSGSGWGRQTFFSEGDYDGEWLHFFVLDNNPGQGGGSVPLLDVNSIQLMSIARVTPIEPGMTDDELISLRGIQGDGYNGTWDGGVRGYNAIQPGYMWNAQQNIQCVIWGVDYSSAGYLSAFGRMWRRQANRRRGDKLEAFYGEPIITDENNYAGNYQIIGYVKGRWIIPLLLTHPYYSAWNDVCRSCHKLAPLNMSGDRDKLLLSDGIVIPWCGLSVIGQGNI